MTGSIHNPKTYNLEQLVLALATNMILLKMPLALLLQILIKYKIILFTILAKHLASAKADNKWRLLDPLAMLKKTQTLVHKATYFHRCLIKNLFLFVLNSILLIILKKWSQVQGHILFLLQSMRKENIFLINTKQFGHEILANIQADVIHLNKICLVLGHILFQGSTYHQKEGISVQNYRIASYAAFRVLQEKFKGKNRIHLDQENIEYQASSAIMNIERERL